MTIASEAINRTGRRTAFIFDLDGTLIDPAGGITGGVVHALQTMELPVPDAAVLNSLIGPKLADGLIRLAGVPAAQVDGVIGVYRKWYREHGMAMSRVYPGMRELLAQLAQDGVPLAVATQKPEPLAQALLTHHGLAEYFHVIHGSHANESLMPGDAGYRPGKSEIIAAALQSLTGHPAVPEQAIMVGDRHQDVDGARSNGLACIGVAWGFAGEGELAAAGADGVVQTAAELAVALAAHAAAGAAINATAGNSGKARHGAV